LERRDKNEPGPAAEKATADWIGTKCPYQGSFSVDSKKPFMESGVVTSGDHALRAAF